MKRFLALLLKLTLMSFVTAHAAEPAVAISPAASVGHVLDAWHKAAADADENRYFSLMAPNAVFLGTDATERWELQAFRTFAHPYFAKGKAWTFVPRNRHVTFSTRGDVAWFDELLDSASYGECRGTGALEKIDGAWKITQYNLEIAVPNEVAKEFVEMVRAQKAKH